MKLTPRELQVLRGMGRRIGSIGGLARAAALTPERRTAIARKAAKARWRKHRCTRER
jgi:hypothetical protein